MISKNIVFESYWVQDNNTLVFEQGNLPEECEVKITTEKEVNKVFDNLNNKLDAINKTLKFLIWEYETKEKPFELKEIKEVKAAIERLL